MAVTVNLNLLSKIQRAGAFDISACFNCGQCTAICPLSKEGEEFPRKIIRYATVGLEEKLVSSPELWSCYYCGECTKTCPRDADPGAFMMAARRYAIQKFGWGGISTAMYTRKTVFFGVMAALSLFLASTILMFHAQISASGIDLFSFIPLSIVDRAGMLMGTFVGISALANLVIMNKYLSTRTMGSPNSTIIRRAYSRAVALAKVIVAEVAIEKRLHTCADRNKYWAHLLMVWGFGGLLIATMLDYMIDSYGMTLPVYVPRGLGIASGLALIYGSVYFIYKRLECKEEYATYSHFTDWTFLLLLLSIGVTGFLLDLFVLANIPLLAYTTYSLHLILVFDLLVTAPFTKFSHALYRPLALWMLEATQTEAKTVETQMATPIIA
jgi:ferredoxin